MALEDCAVSNSERSKSFLYKKYYGYLMAISVRYMKDEMEAEDVVNESFLKIFNKISNFTIDGDEMKIDKAFRNWIARIAVNTSIDKLRVRKEFLALDDLTDADLKNNSVMVESTLEVKEIIALLNCLPAIQKSIFNLYEVEGYSHEEIGNMLNIPESTSRTYLTRAKAKLRQIYRSQTSVIQSINHS